MQMNLEGSCILRVAVTAEDPGFNSGTHYQQGQEYWGVGSLSSLTGLSTYSTVDLVLASQGCTDETLDGFFTGYPVAETWTETTPSWSSGMYTPPGGSTTYFFSLPDLDPRAQGNRVGLSLAVERGSLLGVGWHRSFEPRSGEYAWTPPAVGTLTGYMLYMGTSSSSLNISAPSPWYYVFQP
jgi:hypothetical protein